MGKGSPTKKKEGKIALKPLTFQTSIFNCPYHIWKVLMLYKLNSWVCLPLIKPAAPPSSSLILVSSYMTCFLPAGNPWNLSFMPGALESPHHLSCYGSCPIYCIGYLMGTYILRLWNLTPSLWGSAGEMWPRRSPRGSSCPSPGKGVQKADEETWLSHQLAHLSSHHWVTLIISTFLGRRPHHGAQSSTVSQIWSSCPTCPNPQALLPRSAFPGSLPPPEQARGWIKL